MLLQTEADGIPTRHDVIGDDTAEGVRHNGHFAALSLKVRVPFAEERVQSIQLLCKALCNLEREGSGEVFRRSGGSQKSLIASESAWLSLHPGKEDCCST